MEQVLTVKAIKGLIKESQQEFKAKIGNGVESGNKANNGKAYSDAKKRAKDFDGGLSDEVGEKKAEYKKEDFNKTLMDYTPDNVTPEYKKRVKKEFVNGDDENEKVYKELKKSGEEQQKNEKELKKSGLQAREWPDEVFDKDNMYESRDGFDMRKMLNSLNEKTTRKQFNESHVKTVLFKKTEFLNEAHMISRIPDDFKKNGTSFKMKDKNGSEYLVEWDNNKANIIEHVNKKGMDESISRMKELFDYRPSDTKTNYSDRLNENDDKFQETLNKMRKII